ncbi:MAG: fibronectin type III domain-containing protein [Chloroflexota bacterium]
MRHPLPFPAAVLAVLLAVSPATAATPATGDWAPLTTSSAPLRSSLFEDVLGMERGPDGLIYVCGWFLDAGGDPTADYLAVYDPATEGWHGLGSNGAGNGAFDGPVYAMAWYHGTLIVGGSFSDAGGMATADNLAAWTGSTWTSRLSVGHALSPFNDAVNTLAVAGDSLYVGGDFTNASELGAGDAIVRWNGRDLSTVAPVAAADGPFAGGTSVGDIATTADGRLWVVGANGATTLVAAWDPGAAMWSGLGGPAFVSNAGFAYTVAVNATGTAVTIGGSFLDWGGAATADGVARWNGTAWSGLGSNGAGDGALAVGTVSDLRYYGTSLLVAGNFTGPSQDLAAWNGSKWLAMGTDAPGILHGILPVGRVLYAGGSFSNMGGHASADSIAAYGLAAPPSAPRSLAAAAGSKRITLSWAAPVMTNGAPVMDYVVQYRKAGTTPWKTFADGVRTTRSAAITGLTKGATYQVRVLAVNDWGTGATSAVLSRKAG